MKERHTANELETLCGRKCLAQCQYSFYRDRIPKNMIFYPKNNWKIALLMCNFMFSKWLLFETAILKKKRHCV